MKIVVCRKTEENYTQQIQNDCAIIIINSNIYIMKTLLQTKLNRYEWRTTLKMKWYVHCEKPAGKMEN